MGGVGFGVGRRAACRMRAGGSRRLPVDSLAACDEVILQPGAYDRKGVDELVFHVLCWNNSTYTELLLVLVMKDWDHSAHCFRLASDLMLSFVCSRV